jgi:WD40 repeat protein
VLFVAVAWHPKGNLLATASNDGTVRIIDPTTATTTTMLVVPFDSGVTFSDGHRLAGDIAGTPMRFRDGLVAYLPDDLPEFIVSGNALTAPLRALIGTGN